MARLPKGLLGVAGKTTFGSGSTLLVSLLVRAQRPAQRSDALWHGEMQQEQTRRAPKNENAHRKPQSGAKTCHATQHCGMSITKKTSCPAATHRVLHRLQAPYLQRQIPTRTDDWQSVMSLVRVEHNCETLESPSQKFRSSTTAIPCWPKQVQNYFSKRQVVQCLWHNGFCGDLCV